ncbi:uncharacterized protein GLRG_03113 [Colletotrichum graminicola M1.001]|uniref:Uncharacterized protein n=1 Tax=Colletotrichum graminicola (strain M1.001 / M2 / FGSC 10212) TaxID=645133 RepID=E3QAT1_COLGM|nr:uncharacterized protein GLRG_03113 [Colletotrichum graminicola M1.001]EFQ27969.1 hypothetical protein GLRG_03113 [Colletotrichum graminicola M1.001]
MADADGVLRRPPSSPTWSLQLRTENGQGALGRRRRRIITRESTQTVTGSQWAAPLGGGGGDGGWQ